MATGEEVAFDPLDVGNQTTWGDDIVVDYTELPTVVPHFSDEMRQQRYFVPDGERIAGEWGDENAYPRGSHGNQYA